MQIFGTAIETKMAPSYANIFMGKLESDLLERAPTQPIFWRRFIVFVWTEGEERLSELLAFMNSFHDTIKFTFSWSSEKVNFLDVTVVLDDGI